MSVEQDPKEKSLPPAEDTKNSAPRTAVKVPAPTTTLKGKEQSKRTIPPPKRVPLQSEAQASAGVKKPAPKATPSAPSAPPPAPPPQRLPPPSGTPNPRLPSSTAAASPPKSPTATPKGAPSRSLSPTETARPAPRQAPELAPPRAPPSQPALPTAAPTAASSRSRPPQEEVFLAAPEEKPAPAAPPTPPPVRSQVQAASDALMSDVTKLREDLSASHERSHELYTSGQSLSTRLRDIMQDVQCLQSQDDLAGIDSDDPELNQLTDNLLEAHRDLERQLSIEREQALRRQRTITDLGEALFQAQEELQNLRRAVQERDAELDHMVEQAEAQRRFPVVENPADASKRQEDLERAINEYERECDLLVKENLLLRKQAGERNQDTRSAEEVAVLKRATLEQQQSLENLVRENKFMAKTLRERDAQLVNALREKQAIEQELQSIRSTQKVDAVTEAAVLREALRDYQAAEQSLEEEISHLQTALAQREQHIASLQTRSGTRPEMETAADPQRSFQLEALTADIKRLNLQLDIERATSRLHAYERDLIKAAHQQLVQELAALHAAQGSEKS